VITFLFNVADYFRERERHMAGGMIPPLISSQRQESVNRFTGGGFNLKQAQKA
jgi:hypothetical protein